MEGGGSLSIGISFDSQTLPGIITRSSDELDYTLKITDSGGKVVKRYNHKDEIPESIRLYEGDYIATVTSGENPAAAFDSPYFTGSREFNVTSGQNSTLAIVCTLTNAKVSVIYSERMLTYFTNLKTSVGKSNDVLNFTPLTTKAGFFKASANGTTLKWTLNATNSLGNTLTREEELTINPRYYYTLKFDVSEPGESGGMIYFSISIQEDATLIEDPIGPTLLKIPEINGIGFPIGQQLTLLFHQDQNIEIGINGFPSISAVNISHNCQYLSDYDIPSGFDLLTVADAKLSTVGIGRVKVRGNDSLVFSLTDLLKTKLPAPPQGQSTYNFDFRIDVTAENGKHWQETLKLLILKSDVMTEETQIRDIWSYHTTVRGKWVGAGNPTSVTYQYQKEGDGDNWMETPEITVNADKTFSYELSGLQDGTKYNFRAKAENVPANTCSFTTEEARQLPNSDFEIWDKTGKTVIPYLNGSTPFWESGNHGSSTMSVNVTNPTNDSHSGRAAELKSQFVGFIGIGKFAAGNLFAGSFALDGTDGILTFDRTYNSRPTRFQGYFKYQPSTISDGDLPKDRPDTCSIYIALYDGEPIVVKTKKIDETAFNKNDPRVIAYAEVDASQYSTTEYQHFDLELEYRSLGRRPKYIMIVCAASKYGDYFCGGRGSTLFVDDFKLVFK